MLPRSFVLCGACVSATGRRSFVLPRSCLVVRGPATLPLVASEREGLGPWGCPRSLSSAGSHGTPAARGAASAVPPVASGSATRRRRARAGPFGVQRAGQLFVGIRVLLIADGSSFGVRHVSPDQFAQRSGPRCGRLTSSFLLWHRESCTAPRRVAVEFNAFSGSVVINHTCIRRCCGPRVEGSGTGGGTELSKRQPPQQCAKCDSYRSARATKCAPP